MMPIFFHNKSITD